MKKWTLLSILVIILLTLSACRSIKATEHPEILSIEEEHVYEAIATAKVEKTQAASIVSPYAEISDEEQKYLAFWFLWNDETVFLPIAEFKSTEISLPACQVNSGKGIAIGELFSGFELSQDECLPDEQALENALPTIKISGYFEKGIEIGGWNIIDLQGNDAEKISDVVTFIIKNDFLGSGDLTLSLHRIDGFNGSSFGDKENMPVYTLPAESLQITYSSKQLADFEYADDVVYALERVFTWKIPDENDGLVLSPGDENWFLLEIDENGREPTKAYIQIIGVGIPDAP